MNYYKNIFNMPALNWLFFECYFSLHSNSFTKLLRDDMQFLVKLNGYLSMNDLKNAKQMVDNQYGVLAREEFGAIPYLYLSHDCLFEEGGKTVAELQNENGSYSFDNIPLKECKETMEIAFEYFNEELQSHFGESSLFKEKSSTEKQKFLQRIKLLKRLDFDSGSVEDYAFDILTIFLQDSEVPKLQNFKQEYLRNLGFSLDALGLKSFSELDKISVYDYYSSLTRRHEDYLKQKALLAKNKKK